jgi:hypothetical protein
MSWIIYVSKIYVYVESQVIAHVMGSGFCEISVHAEFWTEMQIFLNLCSMINFMTAVLLSLPYSKLCEGDVKMVE